MKPEDMNMHEFAKKIKERIDFLQKNYDELYQIDVTKDELYQVYLDAFPEGTNPVFKERRYHDCNTCKSFIRHVGGMVAINNNKLETVWDIELDGPYGEVAKKMNKRVKASKIRSVYSTHDSKIGAAITRQETPAGIVSWNHFYANVNRKYVKTDSERINIVQTIKQGIMRSIAEINESSIQTVLELIEQNTIYRGSEFKKNVQTFYDVWKGFHNIHNDSERDLYLWATAKKHPVAAIRSTVIGTLLIALSEGQDINAAVASYESKVAPANYKRPTALITKKMIEKALQTIDELGYTSALDRRFATPEDLSVNDIVFVNRETASSLKDSDLKTSLLKEAKTQHDLSKIETISIDDFIENIVPKLSSIELLVENRLVNNLMTLTAPVHEDAKNIFKWSNNIAWSYNGNVTDSIKQRVKNAGGNVEGIIRASLSWYNYDDLDIHAIEPNKNRICYSSKRSNTSGHLDVDMNVSATTRNAVENIVWTNKNKILPGEYNIYVHNFTRRESVDVGFEVEIEFGGQIHNFVYEKSLANQKEVKVCSFQYKNGMVENIKPGTDIKTRSASREEWGIKTEDFHRVNIVTISPNHWHGENIGNKHYFFLIEGCKNNMPTRGIYNEYLKPELDQHRKVFEMIGDKTKCQPSDRQLSGVGFSSTQKNYVILKVRGSFNRTLKVTF